ncbi:MAG: DUF3006 domain-containing protein [Thermacetogeniaceae bacterium]
MLIIDRFEGDWAVIEFEETTFNLPRVLLPSEAREGDVIRISVTLDKKATAERRERIEKLMDELFED